MIKESIILKQQKQHLADLLVAIERCIYFLEKSSIKCQWPLSADFLKQNDKDVELFEVLSAINERFAKLQDILASSMRHALILSGEHSDNFLKILSFYEKQNIIHSTEQWQLYRTVRNTISHDYEIDYSKISDHFNLLYELKEPLIKDAINFADYCDKTLGIRKNEK